MFVCFLGVLDQPAVIVEVDEDVHRVRDGAEPLADVVLGHAEGQTAHVHLGRKYLVRNKNISSFHYREHARAHSSTSAATAAHSHTSHGTSAETTESSKVIGEVSSSAASAHSTHGRPSHGASVSSHAAPSVVGARPHAAHGASPHGPGAASHGAEGHLLLRPVGLVHARVEHLDVPDGDIVSAGFINNTQNCGQGSSDIFRGIVVLCVQLTGQEFLLPENI